MFYIPASSPNTQYETCFLNSSTECFIQGRRADKSPPRPGRWASGKSQWEQAGWGQLLFSPGACRGAERWGAGAPVVSGELCYLSRISLEEPRSSRVGPQGWGGAQSSAGRRGVCSGGSFPGGPALGGVQCSWETHTCLAHHGKPCLPAGAPATPLGSSGWGVAL